MAVGDNATVEEAKMNGDEAAARAPDASGASSELPSEPAPQSEDPAPTPEGPTPLEPKLEPMEMTAEVSNVLITEEIDIKDYVILENEDEDSEPAIKTAEEPAQPSLDLVERGIKRKASEAFSDGGKAFKGFDVGQPPEEQFKGFDIVNEKDVSVDYGKVRDGSRPYALSSTSDREGGLLNKVGSSPTQRGRRARKEKSSPLLRVPLEKTRRPAQTTGAAISQAGPSTPQFPRRSAKPRRSLPLDRQIADALHDSGSDDEVGNYFEEEEGGVSDEIEDDGIRQECTDRDLTVVARRLRNVIIQREEMNERAEDILAREGMDVDVAERERNEGDAMNDRINDGIEWDGNVLLNEEDVHERGVDVGRDVAGKGNEDGMVHRGRGPAEERENLANFSWSEDFSTFSGQEETYLRSPGPLCTESEPLDLFLLVWDLPIVTYMVTQCNKYASDFIERCAEKEGGLNDHLMNWQETTVDEMYRFLAILNLMSICKFDRIDEYWATGILEPPAIFRNTFSRTRFQFLLRFLHFVDNDNVCPTVRSYNRKIAKIAPLLNHLNRKFPELYTPYRHLSLDESLLLWKGCLSWRQCIRSKAARFGIKSFNLCEAVTGYTLRCILYAGKDVTMCERTLDGFNDYTAKVVLDVCDGYLDVGHCLVMDNWYNQLPLTRHLKERRTDVIGTLNRNRKHVPLDIQSADESRMERGAQVSRHCGDMTLICWKDVKLVTTISTYHNADQVPGQRAGVEIMKPKLVDEYNKYMGGVDLRDQKLSAFHFERKRGIKWYIKVFRRLLNTSLLNAYVIYQRHPRTGKFYSHRQFRLAVARDLLAKFPKAKPAIEHPLAAPNLILRLDGRDHYQDHTERKPGTAKHMQKRCKYCTAKGVRTMTVLKCIKCNVALCLGKCFREYHTRRIL